MTGEQLYKLNGQVGREIWGFEEIPWNFVPDDESRYWNRLAQLIEEASHAENNPSSR